MPRDLALVDCLLFDGTDGSTADDRGVLIGTDGPIRAVGASDDVLAEAREAHIVDLAARAALRSGVTTVRLVGESRYADFALRRAIDAGAVDGPRIFTAGHALCCTGGHGWDADGLEADGADGFRRATREQLRAGADLMKVCISGGIAGEHESIDTPQLSDDEMAAVMETAHDWGRKVTSHAGPAPVIARTRARPGLRRARLRTHRRAHARHGPPRCLVRADDRGQPVRGVLRRQAAGLVAAGANRIEFGTPHGLQDEHGIELLGRHVLPALKELT